MVFNGLSSKEVDESRGLYGSNVVTEAKQKTFLECCLDNLKDGFILLLIAISVIMFVLGFVVESKYLMDGIGILISIVIVVCISSLTEISSNKSYQDLRKSIKGATCKVLRDGKVKEVLHTDLVVGDFVILQGGEKIWADGLLIDGSLRVNNSTLNGEPDNVPKSFCEYNLDNKLKLDWDLNKITSDTLLDSHSLFRGTTVFDGTGIMLVRGIGENSYEGMMSSNSAEEVDSPLKVKLNDLANKIAKLGYIGAVVIFIALLLLEVRDYGSITAYFTQGISSLLPSLLKIIAYAIVIIVCVVPEGLPLLTALVLMQNSKKLLESNVLVRKAIGIETAGSLNILCTDKTGTITKGVLEVVNLVTLREDNTWCVGSASDIVNNKEIELAIQENNACYLADDGNILGGNSTDLALVKAIGVDKLNNKGSYTVINKQDFSSSNKFSQVELELEINKYRTYYKGMPEKLISKAKQIKVGETIITLTDDLKESLNRELDILSSKAMRLLAFGYSDSEYKEDEISEDFVLLGLVAIRDDVRPEAIEAIKEVQSAGVQVIMITGDKRETAYAIAKDSGIIQNETDLVLTSDDLKGMSDDELKEKLKDIRVIARALPMDKLRLVRIGQSLGQVIGMTGDGSNDGPALRQADVGFAIGSGTDAAKESSEIVIIDDNFKSIKDAVLYGRTIYNNILKFCKFQLTINVCALIVSLLGTFVGIHEPITVIELLFINLVCDSLGSLMIGCEPALRKYMKEKPKKRDQALVSKSMFMQIVTMGVYMGILSMVYLMLTSVQNMFASSKAHLTSYFALLIMMSMFNGFNVRTDDYNVFKGINDNKYFLKVWFLIIILLVLMCTFGGKVFGTTAFNIQGWLLVTVLGATVIPVDLVRKFVVKAINK